LAVKVNKEPASVHVRTNLARLIECFGLTLAVLVTLILFSVFHELVVEVVFAD